MIHLKLYVNNKWLDCMHLVFVIILLIFRTLQVSVAGNLKTLIPSPQTHTTDWVHGLLYGPVHGLPLQTPFMHHPLPCCLIDYSCWKKFEHYTVQMQYASINLTVFTYMHVHELLFIDKSNFYKTRVYEYHTYLDSPISW